MSGSKGGGSRGGRTGGGGKMKLSGSENLSKERLDIVNNVLADFKAEYPDVYNDINEIKFVSKKDLGGKGGTHQYLEKLTTIAYDGKGNARAFENLVRHELGHAVESHYQYTAKGGVRRETFQEAIYKIHAKTKDIFIKDVNYRETFANTFADAKLHPGRTSSKAMAALSPLFSKTSDITASEKKSILSNIDSIEF